MTRLINRLDAAISRRPRLLLVASLLAIAATLLLPLVADARAGGGNHGGGGGSTGFHSGSSFGGGSSYGGSSSFGFGGAWFLLPLLFGGGGIGLFIVIFLLMKMAGAASGGGGGYAPTAGYEDAPMQYAPSGQPLAGEGLAAIKAADPGFDETRFLDRTSAAWGLLQSAWMERNIDMGRAYMSTGLYTTWKAQVDAMTAAHKKNVLQLHIDGQHIVRATHDDNYDTISVRIDGSGIDYEVDDQTGKKVYGDDKHDTSFTEYWTFQRSAGAKTLVSGGITEQKCPNCGAPLQVNQSGECRYCNAPVTSGKFDWVLARIDQADEWR